MEGVEILEGMSSGAILEQPELVYILTVLNQLESVERHACSTGFSQTPWLNMQREYLKVMGEWSPKSEDESESVTSIISVIRRQRKILADFNSQVAETQSKVFGQRTKSGEVTTATMKSDPIAEPSENMVGQSIETIAGNNPTQWPARVREFLEELKAKSFNVFFDQPFVLHSNYLKELALKIKSSVKELGEETEKDDREGSLLVLIANMLISLMRGSFVKVLESISTILKILNCLSESEEQFLVSNLKKYLSKYFMELLKTARNPPCDFYMNQSKDLGSTSVVDMSSGDFKGSDGFCLCSDSLHVYELLSQNGTIELSKRSATPIDSGRQTPLITKTIARGEQKHVSMALIGDSLYVRHALDASYSVDVYSCQSLERVDRLKLDVEEYMKNVHLAQYNKLFHLFTDGKSLMTVLVTLRTVKLDVPETLEKEKKEEAEESRRVAPVETRRLRKPREDNVNEESNAEEVELRETGGIDQLRRLRDELDMEIIDALIRDEGMLFSRLRESSTRALGTLPQRPDRLSNNFMTLPSQRANPTQTPDQGQETPSGFSSFGFIKNLFKSSLNRASPSKVFKITNDDNPEESEFSRARFEILTQTHLLRQRTVTGEKVKVKDDGVRHVLEFKLLKFDVGNKGNTCRPLLVSRRTSLDSPCSQQSQRMYHSFCGLYTETTCGNSIDPVVTEQWQSSIVLFNGRSNVTQSLLKPEVTLLHEGLVTGYDFKNPKTVKPFTTAKESLMRPSDIAMDGFFVRENFVLHKNGCLFYLSNSLETEVDFDEFKDVKEFCRKRVIDFRNKTDISDLQFLIFGKRDSHKSEKHSCVNSNDNSVVHIKTKLIKKYAFPSSLTSTLLFFDNDDKIFTRVTFERVTVKNSFVIKKTYKTFGDNLFVDGVRSVIGEKENILQSRGLLHSLLNSSTSIDFIKSSVDVLEWIGKRPSSLPSRERNWVSLFERELLILQNSGTKGYKKSNFKNKIKNIKAAYDRNGKEAKYKETGGALVYFLVPRGDCKSIRSVFGLSELFKVANVELPSLKNLTDSTLLRSKDLGETESALVVRIMKREMFDERGKCSVLSAVYTDLLFRCSSSDDLENFLKNCLEVNDSVFLERLLEYLLELNDVSSPSKRVDFQREYVTKILFDEFELRDTFLVVLKSKQLKDNICLQLKFGKTVVVFIEHSINSALVREAHSLEENIAPLKMIKSLLEALEGSVEESEYREVIEWSRSRLLLVVASIILKLKIKNVKNAKLLMETVTSVLGHLQLSRCSNSPVTISGPSLLDCIVLETSHPIVRGRNTTFKQIHNRNAIGYFVEFDPMSQDDSCNDSLIVSSCFKTYSDVEGSRSPIVTSVKTVNCNSRDSKQSLFVVGNTLDVQFISSNHANKNGTTLLKWGYRLFIKPLLLENSVMSTSSKFNCFGNQVQVISHLLLKTMKPFLCCTAKTPEGTVSDKILEWNMIRKGLTSMSPIRIKDVESINVQSCKMSHSENDKSGKELESVMETESVMSDKQENHQANNSQIFTLPSILALLTLMNELEPLPYLYQVEKKKLGFTPAIQDKWTYILSKITVCMLHHSDKLNLVINEPESGLKYTLMKNGNKQWVRNMAIRKNEIVSHMLKETHLYMSYQEFVQEAERTVVDAIRSELAEKCGVKEGMTEKECPSPVKTKKDRLRLLAIQNSKKGKKQADKKIKEKVPKQETRIGQGNASEVGQVTKKYFSDYITSATFFEKLKQKIARMISESTVDVVEVFRSREIHLTIEFRENVKIIVDHLIKRINSSLEGDLIDLDHFHSSHLNGYLIVSQQLEEKIDFLLKLKNTIEDNEELMPIGLQRSESYQVQRSSLTSSDNPKEELQPLGLNRCLTDDRKTPNSFLKKNKIDDVSFGCATRSCSDEMDLFSRNSCPIFTIQQFLCNTPGLKLQVLRKIIYRSHRLSSLRIESLKIFGKLFGFCQDVGLQSTLFGFLASEFSSSTLFNGIQSIPRESKKEYLTVTLPLLEHIMLKFVKMIEEIKSITEIEKVKCRFEVKNSEREVSGLVYALKTNCKEIVNALADLNVIMKSFKEAEMLNDVFCRGDRTELLGKFVRAMSEMQLAICSVMHFSDHFEDCKKMLRVVFDLIAANKHHLTPLVDLEVFIGLLRKEVGIECIDNETVFSSTAASVNDPVAIDRQCLLLRDITKTVEHVDSSRDLCSKNIYLPLITLLMTCDSVLVVNMIGVILKRLAARTKNSYQWYKENVLGGLQIKTSDNLLKQQFEEYRGSMSVVDLVVQKIHNLVVEKLTANKVTADSGKRWSIWLHLDQEEDFSFILKVLYHWDCLHPSFSKNLPSTMTEYRTQQTKKSKESIKATKPTGTSTPEGFNSSILSDQYDLLREPLLANIDLSDVGSPVHPILGYLKVLGNDQQVPCSDYLVRSRKNKKSWDCKGLNRIYYGLMECLKNLYPPTFKTKEVTSGAVADVEKEECVIDSELMNFSEIMPLPKSQNGDLKEATSGSKTIENGELVYFNCTDDEKCKIEMTFVHNYRYLSTLIEICKSLQLISFQMAYYGSSPLLVRNTPLLLSKELSKELSYLINSCLLNNMIEIPVASELGADLLSKVTQVLKPINENIPKTTLQVSLVSESMLHKIFNYNKFISDTRIPLDQWQVYANTSPLFNIKAGSPSNNLQVTQALVNMIEGTVPRGYYSKRVYERLTAMASDLGDDSCALVIPWLMLTTKISLKDGFLKKVCKKQNGCSQVLVNYPNLSGKNNEQLYDARENDLMEKSETQENTSSVSNSSEPEVNMKEIFKFLKSKISSYQSQGVTDMSQSIADFLRTVLLLKYTLNNMSDEINKMNREDVLEFINSLLGLIKIETRNANVLEKEFLEYLTLYLEQDSPEKPIVIEQFESQDELRTFEKSLRKTSVQLEELRGNKSTVFKTEDYIHPKVSIINNSNAKESSRTGEYRLLRHWEKMVMPKLLTFVKGTLSTYEIDDFFEQIRIELRKENSIGASNIAYIISDQKLPNDCVLPDINHDWSSLNFNELHIGLRVSVNLKNIDHCHVMSLETLRDMGMTFVRGVVLFKDPVCQTVCLQIYNPIYNTEMSVWVRPVQLYPIETTLLGNSSGYSRSWIESKLRSSLMSLVSGLGREILCRALSLMNTCFELDFSFYRIVLNRYFSSDCINSWSKLDMNDISSGFDFSIEEMLKRIDRKSFMEDLVLCRQSVSEYFKEYNYTADLTKNPEKNFISHQLASKNPKLFNLNILEQDSNAGVVVEFKKNSRMLKCSGIKVYMDKEGNHLLKHIKAELGNDEDYLSPMVFHQSDVYFQYYYIPEALSPFQRDQTPAFLEATVFLVPREFNYLLFGLNFLLEESVKSKNGSGVISVAEETFRFLNGFQGPGIAFQSALRFATKLLFTLCDNQSLFENSEIEKVENSLRIISAYVDLKTKGVTDLVSVDQDSSSSLIVQSLIEFLVSYKNCQSLFSHLGSNDNCIKRDTEIVNDLQLLFSLGTLLVSKKREIVSKDIIRMIQRDLSLSYLFGNVVLIKNLRDIHKDTAIKFIEDIARSQRMKIVNAEIDVYVPINDHMCSTEYIIVLFDGWEFPGPDVELLSEEDKSLKKEEVVVERLWMCEICTLLNADDGDFCIACEFPKPAHPRYPEEEARLESEEKLKSIISNTKFSRERYESAFVSKFISEVQRISPSKNIEVKFLSPRMSSEDLENQFELVEFLMSRAVDDRFNRKLKQVCQRDYFEISKSKLISLEFTNGEELFEIFAGFGPVELFTTLLSLGYDLWLEKSGVSDRPTSSINMNMRHQDVEVLLKFIEEKICNSNEFSYEFQATQFKTIFRGEIVGDDIERNLFSESLSILDTNKNVEFACLACYSLLDCRIVTSILFNFNKLIKKYYKFVLFTPKDQNQNSFTGMLSKIRRFWLESLKDTICKDLLQMTEQVRERVPKVQIERLTKERQLLSLSNSKTKNILLDDNSCPYLKQALSQFRNIDPSQLKPQKPKGSEPFISFEIKFKNEHVMGEGGPYRQFFSDISNELTPIKTANAFRYFSSQLFVLTPNALHDIGDNKNSYNVNSSLDHHSHLEMYELVGLLMGCAFRTFTYLPLKLSKLFWKRFLKIEISIEDVMNTDIGLRNQVNYIKSASDSVFKNELSQNFTVIRLDQSVEDLIENGSEIQVDESNKDMFIRKLTEYKLREGDKQVDAVRRGFLKVIPEFTLNCLSEDDIEVHVCGRDRINFDLLKKHTIYSGSYTEDSLVVRNFWKVLPLFKVEDQFRFIKFCWGQERIPTTEAGFENANIRFMIKSSGYAGNQDGILPRADTCFFNFELPAYSTEEIMKEKILLAIHTDCDSMNAENVREQEIQEESGSWVSVEDDEE